MHDLTIEAYYHCESAASVEETVSGSNGATYEVTLIRMNRGECHCTCKAFKFGKGKPCKHIKAVQAKTCGWMEFVNGGDVDHDANGNPVCPQCGGPVGAMNYGV
jgi:hypothetical protein